MIDTAIDIKVMHTANDATIDIINGIKFSDNVYAIDKYVIGTTVKSAIIAEVISRRAPYTLLQSQSL